MTLIKVRTRRTVSFNGMRRVESLSPQNYDTNNVPVQWRAWLSHTRQNPPSIEEIVKDLEFRELVKERARKLEEEWQKRKVELMKTEEYRMLMKRVEEENRGRVVLFEEDATATLSGMRKEQQQQQSTLPQGQTDEFKPGEWIPQPRKKE